MTLPKGNCFNNASEDSWQLLSRVHVYKWNLPVSTMFCAASPKPAVCLIANLTSPQNNYKASELMAYFRARTAKRKNPNSCNDGTMDSGKQAALSFWPNGPELVLLPTSMTPSSKRKSTADVGCCNERLPNHLRPSTVWRMHTRCGPSKALCFTM